VAAPRGRVIDLSHAIREGMTTYPGLPGPELSDHMTRERTEESYGPGVTFHIGRISMIGNTGTYLDSPFHRYEGGTDLAGLALQRMVDLDGNVIRVRRAGVRAVDVDDLEAHDVAGRAVLVHTGWDRLWGTEDYGRQNPYLTGSATTWLVDHGPALVGIDSVNIDAVEDRRRPAHSGLLEAGIPIVEHLRGLDRLPDSGFRFHAAPPAVESFGTFPVRAYAVIPAP
jgi:kynurenine formamidase